MQPSLGVLPLLLQEEAYGKSNDKFKMQKMRHFGNRRAEKMSQMRRAYTS